MRQHKRKISIYLLISMITFLFYQYFILQKSHKSNTTHELRRIFPSLDCKCKSEEIFISDDENEITVLVKKGNITRKYNVDTKDLRNSKCDVYNVVRRGPHQKIISYTLYGNGTDNRGRKKNYYNLLKRLVVLNNKIYNGWIMRIYFDDSTIKSLLCDIECHKGENNEFYDNVDFCYLGAVPFGLPFDMKHILNATYMHLMIARWLPIDDPFVDYFISRDVDALISNREKHAVDEWIKEKTLFHIMRGTSRE